METGLAIERERMSSDTSDERSEEGVDSNVLFGRMLFIYAKDGRVKCYSADEIRPIESEVKGDGWHHTATIDPARWIEAMANGSEDPSDILDEIQFKQNARDESPNEARNERNAG